MANTKAISRGGPVSCYLSGSDLDKLDEIAQSQGKSRAKIVQGFILIGMKSMEKTMADKETAVRGHKGIR